MSLLKLDDNAIQSQTHSLLSIIILLVSFLSLFNHITEYCIYSVDLDYLEGSKIAGGSSARVTGDVIGEVIFPLEKRSEGEGERKLSVDDNDAARGSINEKGR